MSTLGQLQVGVHNLNNEKSKMVDVCTQGTNGTIVFLINIIQNYRPIKQGVKL